MSLPLTASQHAMWLLHTISGRGALFNVAECLEFAGKIEADLLEQALNTVWQANDTLNGVFAHNDNFEPTLIPRQTQQTLKLVYLDDDVDSLGAFMAERVTPELNRAFDLSSDALMRCTLVRSPSKDYLFIVAHHLLLDGYGFGLFHQALSKTYTALLTHQPLPKLNFSDQASLLAAQSTDKYLSVLTSAKETLNDWLDKAGEVRSFSDKKAAVDSLNQRQHAAFDRPLWQTIQSAANMANATPSEVLLGAIAVALGASVNADKVTLGLVMMNRQLLPELTCPTVQSNVLPLPLTLSSDANLSDFTQQINRQIKALKKAQCYRVEHLKRDRQQAGYSTSVIGPTINLLPFSTSPSYGEVKTTSHILSAGTTDDLMLQIHLNGDVPAKIDFDSNPERYQSSDIEHIQRLIFKAAEIWASHPAKTLADVLKEVKNAF